MKLVLHKAIKRARARAGISQQTLADRLSMSQSHVCQIESGMYGTEGLNERTMMRFAAALNITPVELLQLGYPTEEQA